MYIMFFKDYAGARGWGPSPRGRTYQVRSPELKPPHHQNKQTNKQTKNPTEFYNRNESDWSYTISIYMTAKAKTKMY
jgi:hypothetical protein